MFLTQEDLNADLQKSISPALTKWNLMQALVEDGQREDLPRYFREFHKLAFLQDLNEAEDGTKVDYLLLNGSALEVHDFFQNFIPYLMPLMTGRHVQRILKQHSITAQN